jgi:voltage-gated potassium channel
MTLRPDSIGWRATLYDIIFEADTPAGRWFDIGLLIAILASITIVSLETVPGYQGHRRLMFFFESVEWFLTILFTIEYVLRLSCVRKPLRYAFSFWGVIDLLSILPSYATLVAGTSSSFVIMRSIRLLRVFRVLKLWRMMNEADELGAAIWKARQKIVVFLMVVLVAVTISGTLMYHIESFSMEKKSSTTSGESLTDQGESLPSKNIERPNQFTSIPMAMYWAIITMTTVGYGDIVPQTTIGKMISAVLILLGYSLIIVPSTFVSAEFLHQKQATDNSPCHNCHARGQRTDAAYCYRCGERLDG